MNVLVVGNINWHNFRNFHVLPLIKDGHTVTVLSDVTPDKCEYVKDMEFICLYEHEISFRSIVVLCSLLTFFVLRFGFLDKVQIYRLLFVVKNVLPFVSQAQKILRKKFDIVHCHFVTRPVCLAVYSCAIKNRIVTSIHGSDIYVSPDYSVVDLFYIKRCFKVSSKIIVPGTSERDRSIVVGCDASKIKIIPWGVDVSCFEPCHSKDEASKLKRILGVDGKLILSVRNFSEIYQLDTILNAFKSVRDEVPDVTLLMVGRGPDCSKIHNICVSLGIEESVLFLGFVEPDRLKTLYQASDVYVQNPKTDALPYSILESLACGTPVVCGEVGSIGDVVGFYKKHAANDAFFSSKGVLSTTELSRLLLLAIKNGKKKYRNQEPIKLFADYYSMQAYLRELNSVYYAIG